MDKHMKLMAVKGLIISMEEQLYMRFQKEALPEDVQKVIVDKYFDAIQEQLTVEDEDKKEVTRTININGSTTHTILATMTYDQIILLALGEVFDDRIYSITCTTKSSSFTMSKDKDIAVEEGMIINVADTSKA